jgi:LPS-assembly lipoprotein
MWSPEHRTMASCLARAAFGMMLAGLLAGCFQPLYGSVSPAGGPDVRDRMASVQVATIPAANGTPEARVGVELRNALIFDMTGGAGGNSPAYELKVQLSSLRQQVIVDITTARPDVEQYGINATYTLVELATGRPVVTGQAFSRVSFDIPGQQQRFAQTRGLRDAQNRAAKVISDSIRSRLASYFIAGT